MGGQALVFWATQYAQNQKLVGSGDIDFSGLRDQVDYSARLLGGTPRYPGENDNTPSTGKVFLGENRRVSEIDFIESPLGIPRAELWANAVRVKVSGVSFRVMHPVHCLASRIAVVVGLGRTTTLSLDQLRTAIFCAHASTGALAVKDIRGALNQNERVHRYAVSNDATSVYFAHQIDVFEAVDTLEVVCPKFFETRYPQLVAALRRKRKAWTNRVRSTTRPPRA